jgi:LysM repeat protein
MALLKQSSLRFDSADASATLRLDRLAEDLAALKKELEEIRIKIAPAVKTETPSAQEENEGTVSRISIHEVRKGDTLFSISRRYGMSVDGLRKLNDLSSRDAIYPGQKLKVKK